MELKKNSCFEVGGGRVLPNCRNCMEKYRKKYRLLNKDKLNEQRRQKRLRTLEVMGNKCIRCGFDDIRALQIDHINGGGAEEIRTWKYKGNYNMNVIKSFLNAELKYQLLCANCNWIKKYENNETSWKFKKKVK